MPCAVVKRRLTDIGSLVSIQRAISLPPSHLSLSHQLRCTLLPLSSYLHISISTIHSYCCTHHFSRLPRVSSLDLSVCPCIDDAAVHFLLANTGCPIWAHRIRCLKLSRCSGLRFQGLEALARHCLNLESVDVSYCSGFGDLEAAALKEVNLGKCVNMSDAGLAKMVVGCSRLENLSLKWCFDISDIGIQLLPKNVVN